MKVLRSRGMHAIYVHIIILEMLLAVVELEQLPAAAPAVVVVARLCVPNDAICCCGLLHLISGFLFIYPNTIYLNVLLGSAAACTTSIFL